MNGVSVVICCYNSAHIIGETLSFLQKQETDVAWEVIVVNNASTDNTSQMAYKQWGLNSVTTLELIVEDTPGLAFARKAGIAKAKYDIVSFVDDDNFVPSNWISEVYKAFENPKIGILGVTATGFFEEKPPEWYEEYKDSFATGELYDFSGDVTKLGCVYGAGMSIRKKIYDELAAKKWKPQLTGRIGEVQMGGEDTEICLATKLLGYEVHYAKDLVIQHCISPERLSLERLKNMTQGFGFADVFLLPYEIAVREKHGNLQNFDSWRQSVFFNYTSKTIRRWKFFLDFKNGKLSELQYQILRIRNKAFNDALIGNKETFIKAFNNVERLR